MRTPKPFYRKQTKTWYVQLGKKQVNLGPDKAEALNKYHALMLGRQDVTEDTQVIAVLIQFLEWAKPRKSDESYRLFKRHIQSFAEHVGEGLPVGKLRNAHVTGWIDACYSGPKRGDNYRRSAIRCVQRAFNWAVNQGILEKSPVAKCEKPAYTPRDQILTAEQWQELVAAVRARGPAGMAFLDFLTLMRQTGCRPQEARLAEVRHFDRKNRCLVFERSESKGFGGKNTVERRVIPLTDVAFELCDRLAKQHGSGALLRNSTGRAWTTDTIKDWFHRLSGDGRCKTTPRYPRIDFKMSAYIIRHTWATEALTNGVDPITVATIMGHTDVKTLMKTYQHINKKGDHLRAAMVKALGPAALLTATEAA